MPENRAKQFQRHVEAIVVAIKTGGQLDDETDFLANKPREKAFGALVKAGLLQPREKPKQATLGEFVIETRYRRENVFLRRQFEAIVLKAGLSFWGKPFQNLRSTQETELVGSYPLHVVTSWLGNSPTIASKHYLQTTEAHFEQAIGESAQFATHSEESTSDTEETALKLEAEKRGNAAQCSLVELGSANNPCLVHDRS